MTKLFFKPAYTGAPNEIMACEGFFISYNPGRERNPLDDILCSLGKIQEGNLGRPETAIVVLDSSKITGCKHLILYGDYREDYQKIAEKGLEACLVLFSKHIEHMTDTSDSLELNLN